MADLPKYTRDEAVLEIPCTVWLPSQRRALLVDLVRLPPEAMTIDVIAHSLASKARYNSHTPYPHYVATHSVLVSDLMPLDCGWMLELEATLHDAAECLVGDMIHPIKRKVPEFKAIENMVDRQIRAFYGLPLVEHELVKAADTKALWLEQHILQGKPYCAEAIAILQPEEVELAAALLCDEMDWRTSRDIFLEHYRLLMQDMAA